MENETKWEIIFILFIAIFFIHISYLISSSYNPTQERVCSYLKELNRDYNRTYAMSGDACISYSDYAGSVNVEYIFLY